MAVCSETKVIVQALEESYEQLRDAFAGLPGAKAPDGEAIRFEGAES
jgi:ATP adenylyltransferase